MKTELRVLMVEDAASDVVLIHHALRKAGLRVRTRRVESRESFLHELKSHPPDVILSDHGVPGFDGFAALAEARGQCPDVPFIFVTGGSGGQPSEDTLNSGAEDCVLKSRLHLLAPAIERALHDAGTRAQHHQLETALHEAEQRLQHLTAEFEEYTDFVYAISGDLRLPLRYIEGFSETMLKRAADRLDQKSVENLKTISRSAQQMSRVIDDLFTYSRIGKTELHRLPLDLGQIAREVMHDLRHETEGRNIEWSIGSLPEVQGDPGMLWLALSILISNALKFTRPRAHARIEIGNADTEREHVVFVRDNGVGFDMHRADRLFRVFQRLHGKEFEGSGVGLAHLRRIVQRHGGRTWVEAAEDEGATFHFALPRSG